MAGLAKVAPMTDKEIDQLSKKIGGEYLQLMTYLDFTQAQKDHLKLAYKDSTLEQIYHMLKSWHDVVVRCGENPRELLAAAFANIGNNWLASKILPYTRVNEQLEARHTTKEQIMNICFPATHTADMATSTGFSSCTSTSDPLSLTKEDSKGKLKKSKNDCLSQTAVYTLGQHMSSVGAFMCDNHCHGTVFRIGSKWVMTAFHVIERILDEHRTGMNDPMNLTRATVTFQENLLSTTRVSYRISTQYYADPHMDVCILEIIDNRQSLPNRLLLRHSPFTSGSKYVHVVGYGNPSNPGKHLDACCETVPPVKVSQVLPWYSQWTQRHRDLLYGLKPTLIDQGYFGYNSDDVLLLHGSMEKGASGAPLMLLNENEASVTVVGMLTHGIPEMFYHLDSKAKALFPHDKRFEVAIKMEAVYKQLNRNSLDEGLRQLLNESFIQ